MGRRNFPDLGAPLGSAPMYTPEAWCVRYIATQRDEKDWRREKWVKYPHRAAAEAGIKMMQHFPPHTYVFQEDGTGRGEWVPTPMVVELWEYIALTNPRWYLHETRTYRNGGKEVFVVRTNGQSGD